MDIKNLLKNLYGLAVSMSLFGGIIVFIILLVGIIVGGNQGESIMLSVNHLVPILIKLAAIAIIIGVVIMYITNNHSLTLKKEKTEAKP